MSGLGGPGLGGTGKSPGKSPGKSIGSQVGSALGGHLSSMGKGGGSRKGFNFSFSNFVKNFKPGYAQTMGDITGKLNQLNQPSAWKVQQFKDKGLDITKMNPSIRFNIDTQRAINSIDNERVRNWLNKYTPQKVKDLRINHQMYSPTKIRPGDKDWKPTGTGSIKLDPDTERYLDWMARVNPEGYTISDYEKFYKRSLDAGMDLYTAMKYNPANTVPYQALIDDKTPPETTTNNNDMTTYDPNKKVDWTNVHDIQRAINPSYQDKLKRNAVFNPSIKGDADYWTDTLMKGGAAQYGDTYGSIKAAMDRYLEGSAEYLNEGIHDLGGVNWGPDDTLAKQYDSNTWLKGFDRSEEGLREAALSLRGINSQLGQERIDDGTPNEENPYLRPTQEPAVGTLPAAPPAAAPPAAANPNGYLTMDDLTKFFNERDAAKNDSGGMDEFMKFMMLLSVMPRGGGGYGGGGSQYGYGGLNPGGVQAAYNPWENMKTGWDFMKNNFGSGSSSSPTTETVNAT